MSWNPLTAADVAQDKFWSTVQTGKIKDCLEYLFGLGSGDAGGDIQNPSFETDSDADGVPDGWTKTLYAGGAFALDTTTPAAGATAVKFTHPGGASNGGGSLTSDYVGCSPNLNYVLGVILWASATGMRNKVQVQFYTKAKVANGAVVDLYNSVANPTTATPYLFGIKPTAASNYFKIILIGGFTDTDVAGSAYFDDVRIAGIFPDVTTGNVMIASAPTERIGSETSYTKVKETRLLRSGTYRVLFALAGTNPAAASNGRIYKNGAALGTERASVGTISYLTFSEDIAFAANDLVQIYCKAPISEDYYVKDFTIDIAADNDCAAVITD